MRKYILTLIVSAVVLALFIPGNLQKSQESPIAETFVTMEDPQKIADFIKSCLDETQRKTINFFGATGEEVHISCNDEEVRNFIMSLNEIDTSKIVFIEYKVTWQGFANEPPTVKLIVK